MQISDNTKILIIRLSSMGDVVKSTVLARLLKKNAPKAHISMLVKEEYKELIEYNDLIDTKLYYKKQRSFTDLLHLLKLRKALFAEKYDIIIDAHSSIRSKILSFLYPCKYKNRYIKPRIKRLLLFLFNINFLRTWTTLDNQFAKLLEPLGIVNDNQGAKIFLNPILESSTLLSDYELTKNKYIVLVPGAAHKGKILPLDFYLKLIHKVTAIYPEFKIVILGGSKEVSTHQAFNSCAQTINLTAKISLHNSIYIASQAKLTIGSDTGILHAAETAGGKVAVFLGPTSRETGAYPAKKESLVFENKLFCRPCSKNGSAPCFWGLGTRRCLNFNIDHVFEKIKDVLNT